MALQTRFGRFDMENQLIFDLKDLGFPWQYLALGYACRSTDRDYRCIGEAKKRT